MTDTVYVLGAGLNQVIKDWHSLTPPMLRDFFRVVLKHPRLTKELDSAELKPLLIYIEKYWKKTKRDLATSDFDLEECFTLLEAQRQDAIKLGDGNAARTLTSIEFSLKSLLAELLSDFEVFAVQSEVMRRFGEILYKEKPIIVSFNYDSMTEAAIESGSRLRGEYPESALLPPYPQREPTEEEIAFSHYNWNRPLGYGLEFDRVQLHRAGVSAYVDGARFYSNKQNKLYDWPILKLHGSLNWFRFLPFRSFPVFEEERTAQPKWMESAVIHVEGHWWMNRPPDFEGWVIDPLLITPVLDKEALFNDPLYNRVFAPLWSKAAEALGSCNKLVIIGYSFSPTDFRTKKLFLEAFATNELKELIIVNPNPTAIERAKELCHFEHPVIFQDLASYVRSAHQSHHELSVFLSNDELVTTFQEGKRLVEALDKAQFELTGAFWFLLPGPGGWKLVLVSSLVDSRGSEEVALRAQEILSSIQPPIGIGRSALVVVSPSDQLFNAMRRFLRTGPGISAARVTGSTIDGFLIEDSYIYRTL